MDNNKIKLLKDIGSKIKKSRKLQNLNQSDMDIPAQQIARYESGENTIGIINLKKICEKLELSADYLLDLPNEFDQLTDEKKPIIL